MNFASNRKSSATHISINKHDEQFNLFATITSDSKSLMIIECSESSRIKSVELVFEAVQVLIETRETEQIMPFIK